MSVKARLVSIADGTTELIASGDADRADNDRNGLARYPIPVMIQNISSNGANVHIGGNPDVDASTGFLLGPTDPPLTFDLISGVGDNGPGTDNIYGRAYAGDGSAQVQVLYLRQAEPEDAPAEA